MSEPQPGDEELPAGLLPGPVAGLSAVEVLQLAVRRLLAEDPVELEGAAALDRARTLLVSQEQLRAAALASVRDVDLRELYALDACGSTRGWLRNQLGGDQGQLELARRLGRRGQVAAALAAGEISGRAAGQLCTALEKVPAQVDEQVVVAVVTDGLADLLRAHTGVDEDGAAPSAAARAVRADLAAVTAQALAVPSAAPAERMEPCLLLLARHLPPGELPAASERLLDALQPQQVEVPDDGDFFLRLTPVLDGAWDLRGLLDPETGTVLARELDRREQVLARAERAAAQAEDGPTPDDGPDGPDGPLGPEDRLHLFTRSVEERDRHDSRPRFVDAARRRHDALAQLLRDSTDGEAGAGRPAPTALTVVCTVEALEGRLGALPGTLGTPGQPISLRPETVRRLGCDSELTVVLVDAAGRPVGASGTHRSATPRERNALRVRWGPACAVAGCVRTVTVPHVIPWWLSRQTVLKDLVPICTPDHRDLHEHHRTLRLKDGRHIDELGWVQADQAADPCRVVA